MASTSISFPTAAVLGISCVLRQKNCREASKRRLRSRSSRPPPAGSINAQMRTFVIKWAEPSLPTDRMTRAGVCRCGVTSPWRFASGTNVGSNCVTPPESPTRTLKRDACCGRSLRSGSSSPSASCRWSGLRSRLPVESASRCRACPLRCEATAPARRPRSQNCGGSGCYVGIAER